MSKIGTEECCDSNTLVPFLLYMENNMSEVEKK